MLDSFRDGRVGELYRYWCDKRGTRLAPRRSDVDPLEIPKLLPIVHLIDVIEEPLRFRHRLVGTEVVAWMKRDVTGQYVDASLYGDAADEVRATLALVAREVRPYQRRARLAWHSEDWLTMESVELPLVDDAGAVTTIMRGASFFLDRDASARRLDFQPLSCASIGAAAPA